MPANPATGKTDRHALSEVDLLDFRLKQHERKMAKIAKEKEKGAAGNPPDLGKPEGPALAPSGSAVKKGKKRARGSSDESEPEDQAKAPSPLEALQGIKTLTLESRGSSADNTPASTPAIFTEPSLPEDPAPLLSTTTRKGVIPTARKSTSEPLPPAAVPA